MLNEYDAERDSDWTHCPHCGGMDTVPVDSETDVVGYSAIGEDLIAEIYWRRCACGHKFGRAVTDWPWREDYTWDHQDKDVYLAL
jgi:hypothetical protein